MPFTAVIVLSPFLWLTRLAVFLVFAIPGVPLVAILAWGRVYRLRFSSRFGRDVLRFPSLFWLWDNSEDGVDGLRGGDAAQQWWADKTANYSAQKRIFVWSALRNPVDSLRFVPLLNPRIRPESVRFVGMDHEPAKGEDGWYFAWQGVYSCIRYERFGWRLWLGWKLKPSDRLGLAANDPRAIRCDFACQLKRVV
jgi:hypothetical protein